MKLEDIKKEAAQYKYNDISSLSSKIREFKNKGVSFLGCVAFVQVNQEISLNEARELTVKLDAYNEDEKKRIDAAYQLMLSEFKEEE
ncbi:hypothetical protein ATO12_15920 [Aquimarina atlantica]|uniref:Uncharacterized protein n=1 Tax=Aquimarina atlantica TaxID=1317122 RepID=A0A023BTU7_9FLAO|nr:hypothetical protein [Aquimarina atlantica]EZH73426.1 hypothetical protein ATO12_15920 [Aquimarina atlantica]